MKNEDITSLITSFIIIIVILILSLFTITHHHYPPQYLAQFDTPYMLKCDTYVNTGQSDKSKERFKYTSPEVVTQIYKLLYITDKIFTEKGIEYFIDGGTFLGAIRSIGQLKWDDDGDLQFWAHDEPLVKSLQPNFTKHNITLKHTWFGYKLYFNDAKSIKGYDWKYPAIDLFPVTTINGKMVYSYPKAQKTFSKCYHDIQTLYPLKRYKFGPIKLWGAAEISANAYLSRCYGSDWATHGYQTFDHENEKEIKNKTKIVLSEDELKPALPIDLNMNF